MTDELLQLVDECKFGQLFINKLGWNQPLNDPLQVETAEGTFTLTEVAEYRGLGVWHCPAKPSPSAQRRIDTEVSKTTIERLIIYTTTGQQEWRWPRINAYKSTGIPTLVPHQHQVGEANPDLVERLNLIKIPIGTQPTIVDVLTAMREAFDREAEAASVAAARLMGALYAHLEDAGMAEKDASILLARLLFLMFGDDTGMWARDVFLTWLIEVPLPGGSDLNSQLVDLFSAANTPEEQRGSHLVKQLKKLPYINGGIFEDSLTIPTLTSEFRSALIDACTFDWNRISPAVFGSMFQTVKSKEARGQLGEFYTTETNIRRTIDPLFLNELRQRLVDSWDSLAELETLHDDLGEMRFLDPACGCGNFLIVTYRELRDLELQLLKRRNELQLAAAAEAGPSGRNRTRGRDPGAAQMSIDPTGDLNVRLDHFHGIEIEPWPARIAETAMFLVDHLANKAMEDDLGVAPHQLPIKIAPHIHNTDALTANWAVWLPPSTGVFIFGNPPFLGQYNKSAAQTALTKSVWGPDYNGYLDFVTCWHKKTIDYFGRVNGHWAFVSTNSVSQGEACAALWRPILRAGWRCRFAHRSFQWTSEDPKHANVHVSIIGFDKAESPTPELWTYLEGGKGDPQRNQVSHINPYLVEYPKDTLVESSTNPLSAALPRITYGSKPTDKQNLLVSPEQYSEVASDAIARRYLRKFVGARELLHNRPRWCLWLGASTAEERLGSPILAERLDRVREMRAESPDPQTRAAASRPHTFQYDRQLDVNYLAIPAHVSELRQFFPCAYFEPDVICGNANFMAPDPSGFLLSILSSTMFITWQKTIGGRLESRIRFSNTFSYNTFPLPTMNNKLRGELAHAGRGIIKAREKSPNTTLAQLYDREVMPVDLLNAHLAVDLLLDPAFGLCAESTVEERQARLFELYEQVAQPHP